MRSRRPRGHDLVQSYAQPEPAQDSDEVAACVARVVGQVPNLLPVSAEPPAPGWDSVAGARGCTAQSCAFRDAHASFAALPATVAGLSVQSAEEQSQFAARTGINYRLISDPDRRLAAELRLPTFSVGGRTFYRRLTLVARAGEVVKTFYPVPVPERNPADVLAWLAEQRD